MSQIVTPNKRVHYISGAKPKVKKAKAVAHPGIGQGRTIITPSDGDIAVIKVMSGHLIEKVGLRSSVRYGILRMLYPKYTYDQIRYAIRSAKRPSLPTISAEELDLLLELTLK